MARTKGTSKLSASLEVQAGAPLDARTVVPTYADLTKPETFQYKYVGMPVVVQETGEMYILTDMDSTLKSNWKAGSSAKGDPAYVSVAKNGYVTTVTAEDARGTTVTYIADGKDGVDGVDGLTPTVSIGSNGTWVINSIDTGVKATGEKGERGEGFSIDAKYNTAEAMVADTNNVADSKMAVVLATKQLYLRVDGYTDGDYDGWMEIGGIGDLNTIKGDQGEKGADGVNGITPTIDPTTKHWMIGDSDTGVVAEGKDGKDGINGVNGTNGTTPTISSTNRHWMIGSYDTGILAQGFTPTVGINASGNWVINDVDTGKTAYPIINGQKHWVVNGTDTNIIAEGKKGDKGDTGDEGFSPTITQERDDNKVTLTINQKTGTETVEIFDGLNSYNDLELRGRIGDAEAAIETLNGDETVEGSVEAKIVEAFSKFTSIKFEKVASLPATGENGVFYLIPANEADASNHYNEYIYIDGAWEFLGTTEIDLTAYAKKTEIPTKVSQLTNDSGYVVNTQKASTTDLGLVKVDGTTITIDADGVIKGTTEIGISEESDNVLTAKEDGLYVPPTDLSAYAKSNAIPTKVSQLTNDSGYITSAAVPTALSELENDLIATTLKAGTVIPDGDTITTDANGRITATIGANSLSRAEGNQIELLDDGIYIGALNEEAIYNSIDAVDLASPILTEYTEDELYHLAWEEIEVKEKEEYTEAELDEILDGIDFSGAGGGGGSGAANIIESISVNGVNIPPDANKNIALTIMTNSVDDLVNYYKKTETYTKTEVDNLIDVIGGGKFEVVESLPAEDINLKAIYLVAKATSETSNVYDEYVYINGAWEKIGDTQIDLSDYVTTEILENALENKLEAQEISQVDFDALSQAEKDNGTAYFISDGDGLVSKTAMGYTPIGTVISVMGNTAPKHYLACDGSVVNISDYPALANYFNTQFGSKNYFGGDGVTTFAVPDLRGEFLRGTGTNSHANQGNGGDVGVHQDATEHALTSSDNYSTYIAKGSVQKYDSELSACNSDIQSLGNTGTNNLFYYTSRPTNTSVLYCIATKNIYIDPKNNYSTDEQVVGTWIDGKPIYQKTFLNAITLDNSTYNSQIAHGISDIGVILEVKGVVIRPSDGFSWSIPSAFYASNENYTYIAHADHNNLILSRTNVSGWNGFKVSFTIQYTKTTD